MMFRNACILFNVFKGFNSFDYFASERLENSSNKFSSTTYSVMLIAWICSSMALATPI